MKLKFKCIKAFKLWELKTIRRNNSAAYLATLTITFLPVEYYIETGSWSKAIKFSDELKRETEVKREEFREAAKEIKKLNEMSKLYQLKQKMLEEANLYIRDSLEHMFNQAISEKITLFTQVKL